jgi:hypothetical protein
MDAYEVDPDGVEQLGLELIFLGEARGTENLSRRHDFPTLLFPMSSNFKL